MENLFCERMSRLLCRFLAAALICLPVNGQAMQPERTVQGNVLTSLHDPALRVVLPPAAQYVGGDRFILYGLADCELHVFVQADAQKNVQQLYWVQFEGYLPSRPEMHHTYDSPLHLQLDDIDFYVDTWVSGPQEPVKQSSDLEHVHALIRSRGYKLPAGMMSVRLVHLLDPEKRRELMIIYSEDLASTGFTAAQLKPGGSARSQWPAIEHGLIERASKRLKLASPAAAAVAGAGPAF